MNDAELRSLLDAVRAGTLGVEAALARLRASTPTQAGPEATSEAHGDEFTRIREITQLFAGAHDQVLTDIGDDAAVLRPQPRPLVLSVDAAVEGVHFERWFLSFAELGARAMSAAVSDLAAMGSQPLAALCSIIAPRNFPHADFIAVHTGIAHAARDYNCPVIGGNLSSGKQLSLTTTVVGTLPGPGLYRTGARPGDEIYVTGPLGSAALGLALLQRGTADRAPELVQAWRAPRARLPQGLLLSGVASAAIDISDGALADLGHICEASNLTAVIEAERVPFAPGMAALARSLGLDPLVLALTGGEDYELIYTLPAGTTDPCHGTRIGVIERAPGPVRVRVRVIDAQGAVIALRDHGYEHF